MPCGINFFNPTGSPGCLRIIIILLKMASYDTDTSSFRYKFSILILKNFKKLNITWLDLQLGNAQLLLF